MGSNEITVQGRGPQSVPGSAMSESTDLLEQTQPSVKVVWSVTRQYVIDVPTAVWERFDGADGPTGDGPMDQYLGDLESITESDVIERNIDTHEASQ